ncbi:Eco57I restriction-modification methylase domain-containing protein [Rhodoferax sp.]|uniref:Eco57I restriction-modification methylase domain-containing protein n=1 Tax=Rhodoferax sp. TaxID=50421 RepID=UPI002ACDC2BD|nr:hypothetical protein [Rhodoferax sp.]MDZ7921963.1 hypothetical protein [Rhodoferax sp.]
MFFHRGAFLPQSWDDSGRTFHAYALNEARLYEEKVSQDLGKRVFEDIFPQLADALARGDLHAKTHSIGYGQFTRAQYTPEYLDEVREAALVLLYRLLFLFYAEDRNLLPVRDPRYAPYSIRRIREDVRDKVIAGGTFSSTLSNIWRDIEGVCQLIDEGDDDIGMPAYNGGLFNRARSLLLTRAKVPDKVMAPIIDALSRRTEELLAGWINYRDLAVAHLGGIYERLLEYSLVHEVQAIDTYKDKPEINRIVAAPASFARKVSGSYYTHDDLVRLILRESVGLLATERLQSFETHLKKQGKKTSLNPGDWDALDAKDPAGQILELKVCDPAMGSGHFLVALVDDIADRVLEAVATATETVNAQPWAAHLVESGRPWQSPVLARIAHIRRSIKTAAKTHGWAVTDAQLDDRHIVRRMILKKTIFGVDKNPMAVELAKTALWLHTFTVGAPLSFLDHHLKIGDSLHGEQLPQVQKNLNDLGMLFQQADLARLDIAERSLGQVADLTDVDIAEARLSKQLTDEAQAQVKPLHALLDFWRALRWKVPGWPVNSPKKLAKLGDDTLRLALAEIFSLDRNLIAVLAEGKITGHGDGIDAANLLLAQTQELAQRESFFHWWTAFPNVWKSDGTGGFDAVIGNPPWDVIEMKEVEWFADRDDSVSLTPNAAERVKAVAALKTTKHQLWTEFKKAEETTETILRVVRESGEYPHFSAGKVNLYKLFVERVQSLISTNGLAMLLTPSGISADKASVSFFKSVVSAKRLNVIFDFENRNNPCGSYFPDVDQRFKFSVFGFGGSARSFDSVRCAFYLNSPADLDTDEQRILYLTATDFENINPNSGTAPMLKSRFEGTLTTTVYRNNPVFIDRRPKQPLAQWPLRYTQGTHNMATASKKFLRKAELIAQSWLPGSGGCWEKDSKSYVRLFEGKMVQMYDHRAAEIIINPTNLHRPAQEVPVNAARKADPTFLPDAQYWVCTDDFRFDEMSSALLGFKDVTSPTNARSAIAAFIPASGAGHTFPLLLPKADTNHRDYLRCASLLLANLNSFACDFFLRQKLQTQHLTLFVLEQLPVIAPERFDEPLPSAFVSAMRAAELMNGHHPHPTVADFVLPQVLALTYTAHDMAPFARDMGYVDDQGDVLPPLVWNEDERRARMAALDAVFFYLYGLNAKDAAYMLDTFPIVREQDLKVFGNFKTQTDILALLGLLWP